MLRLRAYEKLQGLVSQGAVNREVTGVTKKYKGVATRMVVLRAEMKLCGPTATDALSPRLPRLTDCWRPASNSWDAMPSPIRPSDGLVPWQVWISASSPKILELPVGLDTLN